MKHGTKTLAMFGFLSLVSVGCLESSDNRRRDDRWNDNRSDGGRYDPPPTNGNGNWWDDRRYDDDRNYSRDTKSRDRRANADVPRGVKEAAVGKGLVTYRAPYDGRAWITESEFDTVIWSGKVYRGENVEVVPKRDRVFIDRNEVEKRNMKDDIKYRIYFDRDRY